MNLREKTVGTKGWYDCLCDELDSLRAAMDKTDGTLATHIHCCCIEATTLHQLGEAIKSHGKEISRLQEQVTRLQLKQAGMMTGQELADEFTGAGSALRSSMEGGA